MSEPDATSDALMKQLGALPKHDVSKLRSSAMHARARAAFVAAHRRNQPHAAVERLRLAYRRYLEPAWVTALGAAYLGWAFLQVIELQR